MNLAKRTPNLKIIIILTAIFFIWIIGNIPTIKNLQILFTHADWKLSQYNVNYFEHGFIRRGFIGSILFPFMKANIDSPEVQKLFIFWKETVLYFIYGFIFFLFILKKTIHQSTNLRILILSSLLLSPCGLIQAAYDFGRYDHFNFLILASSIFLVEKNQIRIASICLAVSVLIHENSIFFIHPIVTAISFGRNSKRFSFLLKLLFPSFIITILVLIFGDKAINLPVQVSLGEGVWGSGMSLYIANIEKRNFEVIIFSIYLILNLSLLIHFYRVNKLNIDLKFLSCLAPLPLFIIVADYGRWVHFVFINVLIVICYQLRDLRKVKIDKIFYLILITLSLPFGPIGIGNALPYIQLILDKSFSPLILGVN